MVTGGPRTPVRIDDVTTGDGKTFKRVLPDAGAGRVGEIRLKKAWTFFRKFNLNFFNIMKIKNELKLKDILIEVFDLEDSINSINDIESIEELCSWDSLNILYLIAACESEFSIVIDLKDYEKINSIQSIKNILEKFSL